MKRLIFSFFLAFVLLFSLCACAPAADPNAGRYACVRALYPDGTDRPEGAYLTLSADGTAELSLSGTRALYWALDGEDFLIGTLEGNASALRGTLRDGVIEIALEEADCIFVREGVSFTPEPLPEPEPEGPSAQESSEQAKLSELADFWSGDYYGWWFIRDADGAYETLDGAWWDLCASIDAQETGRASMTLWDEDWSRSSPYGEVRLVLDTQTGDAESESGVFGPSILENGDWHFSPDAYEFENLLVLSGTYRDETGSYTYEGYLRPWGQRWDDVEKVSTALLPYYYFSWYLPRIDAGSAMPDVIGEGAEPRRAA